VLTYAGLAVIVCPTSARSPSGKPRPFSAERRRHCGVAIVFAAVADPVDVPLRLQELGASVGLVPVLHRSAD
jgi:hypothetical protein